MAEDSVRRPLVYEFEDYRAFFQQMLSYQKRLRPGMSLRRLAKRVGYTESTNFFSLVLKGKRRLSPEVALEVAKFLGLTKPEQVFFQKLVYYNQAKTPTERASLGSLLLKSRRYQRQNPQAEAQYEYYSNWYTVVVREMLSLDSFRDDPEWIAAQVVPPLTVRQAKHALDVLKRLGLIKQDPDSGRWISTERFLTASSSVPTSNLMAFHQEMIKKGSEALDRFKRNDREITAITFSYTQAGAALLAKKIADFQTEILELVSAPTHPRNRVFQLNFQLFPIASTS